MLKRFIAYYKPHRLMFTLDMLASLLVSLMALAYPIITREMLNVYIPNQNLKMIMLMAILLFILYVIRMFLKFFVQYYGHVVGVKMQAQMRKDMFEKLERLPFSYFDNHETGKIMSRMVSDLVEVSELAHHGPENIFMSIIMIIGAFIYLCTINVALTLIIFVCVPFLALISLFLRKKMKTAFKASRVATAKINAALESSISGIRVTKAFDNTKEELKKFQVGNEEFVESRRKAYKAMGQFYSSTSFVTDVFNVVCLLSGGIFLFNGQINFGDYSAFILSINLFITPVTTLIQFMEQYQNGVTGFERFLEIMDEEEEFDQADAKAYEDLNGDIVFDDVSFGYGDKREILHDVSFKLKKGQTLALVGPSGGGKTTICHLLPRFYEICRGKIMIDGIDIKKIKASSLRRNIGIVQQDVFLFQGSFKDNIAYGKNDASFDEIVDAAKKANIYDYIMSLPDGFETNIGERGVKLSGGQKQRLSIARVFLKNPSILILDEATSALDNTTEILIQKALDSLKQGRTTLVVAHRLSTIQNADEILVISNGVIKEKGNHEELLNKNNGIYHELYQQQFRNLNINLDQNLMSQ